MKKMIVFLVMMSLTSTVYANKKLIKCTGPVGSKIVLVEGLIHLRKMSTGQIQAKGTLKINAKTTLDVGGVYESLAGSEYASLAPSPDKNTSINFIYINFKDTKDSALSFIEMGIKMYPLDCGQRK